MMKRYMKGSKRTSGAFAAKLAVKDVRFVPISALKGDNVVEKSKKYALVSGWNPEIYT